MKPFNINKSNTLLLLSSVIFFCSLFGQIYVTNKLAVKGKEMVELESKKISLEKQISELQLEQTSLTSLSYIEQEALKMGFIKNSSYVSTIQPVSAVTASAAH